MKTCHVIKCPPFNSNTESFNEVDSLGFAYEPVMHEAIQWAMYILDKNLKRIVCFGVLHKKEDNEHLVF